ncbi:MAG: hypothetical protein ACRCU9_05100, partial [Iodobacter sp.]
DSRLGAGNLDVLLDGQSLSQYLKTSSTVKALCLTAQSVGFSFETPDDWDGDGREDWQDECSDLIQMALFADISTIEALDRILSDAVPWSQGYLEKQYRESRSSGSGDEWYITPAFVCELVVIKSRNTFLKTGHLIANGWDEGIAERVFYIAGMNW